jgi:hypothetical protein
MCHVGDPYQIAICCGNLAFVLEVQQTLYTHSQVSHSKPWTDFFKRILT